MQSATGLINRVRGIVGDKALVPRIFENLNDGLAHIVRAVRPPDLQGFATVLVEATWKLAILPLDFFGPRIFEARNLTTGEPIRRIYYRNVEFARQYPTLEPGPVEALLIRGSNLFVANVPIVDESVEIKYLKKPVYFTDLDDDGSLITYLPERLGEKALVFYAAMEEFRIMEDGTDGDKKNMADMKLSLAETLIEIATYFGVENLEDGGPVIAHDTLGLLTGYSERDTLWGRL